MKEQIKRRNQVCHTHRKCKVKHLHFLEVVKKGIVKEKWMEFVKQKRIQIEEKKEAQGKYLGGSKIEWRVQ